MNKTTLKVLAAAAATAVAASFGAPAHAANVTLTYLTSQGWVLDAHSALYKKFEEQTGIAIDAQIVPADQYYNVLKTKLNSGEGPDIFGGQSGVNTLVVDLNVEKNAVDLSGEPWAKSMDPLVASQATVNGKLYGLTYWDPLGLVWVVNYNKKVFAENGIEVPTTYAELKAAAEKLMAAGVQPIYEPVSDGWHHVLWFPELGPNYEAAQPGLADKLNANQATFAGNKEDARRTSPSSRKCTTAASWARMPSPTPMPMHRPSWHPAKSPWWWPRLPTPRQSPAKFPAPIRTTSACS